MKKVLTLLLVISMLFAVVIPSFAEEDYKVCFVCKAPDDYWTAVMNGCQQAADEAGIKVDFFLPEKESADMQVTLVQEAVIAGYDAIVLAPIDPEPLAFACQEAKEKGVVITLVDTMISTEDYEVAYCTDNYGAGKMAAEAMAGYINNEGDVYIINSNPAATSDSAREAGFRDMIAEKYPNINITGVQYCYVDTAVASNQTTDALTANPNIKAIYAPSGFAAIGAANALIAMDRKDVVLCGWDASAEEVALLDEQAVDYMIVQQPTVMGYMGVKAAIDILKGAELPHEIVDTGCTLVTYENRLDPEIQDLFSQFFTIE